MATSDDTSKPRRSRRKHSTTTAVAPRAASPGGGDPLTAPSNLEEAVENVRSLLMQVRATLHCLSDVLLYADDADAVLHAEVAKALEGWVDEAATKFEALRQRGGGEPGEGGADLASRGLYQVREPTSVYMA